MKRQLENSKQAYTSKKFRRNFRYCYNHGKKRTWVNMIQNEEGAWTCIPGKECQVGGNAAMCTEHHRSRTLVNLTKNEDGLWVCKPNGQCQLPLVKEEVMCSVHERLRTIENVSKNENGQWVCDEGSKCKLGSGQSMRKKDEQRQICSVHQRVRTVQNLSKNDDDEWVCIEGSSCMVAEDKIKTEKKPKSSSKVSSASILENQRYKDGNFRGALQEHLKTGVLKYDKAEERIRDGEGATTAVFLSKCRIEGNEDAAGMEGLGFGSSKKQAIQFAALDLIIKLKFVTPEQHLQIHPDSLKQTA